MQIWPLKFYLGQRVINPHSPPLIRLNYFKSSSFLSTHFMRSKARRGEAISNMYSSFSTCTIAKKHASGVFSLSPPLKAKHHLAINPNPTPSGTSPWKNLGTSGHSLCLSATQRRKITPAAGDQAQSKTQIGNLMKILATGVVRRDLTGTL